MTGEQAEMLKVLKIFCGICQKYELQYYAMGGTLLGAVRHGGFIPWDDDVDISMPLKDFTRFLTLTSELPENCMLQSELTDCMYPFLFVKLCSRDCPFQTNTSLGPWGAYIDIFPLIPTGKPTIWTKCCFQIMSVIKYNMSVKAGWTNYVKYKNPVAKFGYAFLNLLSFSSLKRLRSWLLARIYVEERREYLCSPGGAYKADKEFFPAGWFSSDAEMGFEDMTICVPIGWQDYLSRNYGDYMKLPPLEERRSRHRD